MKRVYINILPTADVRYEYSLHNVAGGYAGGNALKYDTAGQAYEAAVGHIKGCPDMEFISPDMVADVLSSTVHYLYTLRSFEAGFNRPTSKGLEELILKIENLLDK